VVSYGEVVQATLGGGGQRLVEALLIISQTGELTPGTLQAHSEYLISEVCWLHSLEVELLAGVPDTAFPPAAHHPPTQHHRCSERIPA